MTVQSVGDFGKTGAAGTGRHNGAVILLVPASVLRPSRVDEHFAEEAAAARALGWDVGLIDHDAQTVSRRAPAGTAIYRGWMLRSEQYATLAERAAAQGITLRTSAAQYRDAHELPGWIDRLGAHTPRAAWTVGDERAEFEAALARLGAGAAVLRDYVKSAKHHWHEAVYIPDVSDTDAAWSVAQRFRELRGDEFVGGFVVRAFERFVGAEVRTWWVDGVCRCVTAHPDTPDAPPPDDLELPALDIDLPFATVDLARRDDGVWRVIELGDGQVSDRPASTPAASFVKALA